MIARISAGKEFFEIVHPIRIGVQSPVQRRVRVELMIGKRDAQTRLKDCESRVPSRVRVVNQLSVGNQ
jgi:hypothetical protein